MKAKYRNLFFLCGLLAIVIMLFSFDFTWTEVWNNLKRAGLWLPVNVALWAVVYALNAGSWYLIIRDRRTDRVPFGAVYKFTVTGFVLNYVTPLGLLGGEPYRIMELSPYVGKAKAASSVILYAMMHIFSHFCFWLGAIVLYLMFYPVCWESGMLFALIGAVCVLAIYFFMKGYRQGLVVKSFRLMGKLPLLKRWSVPYYACHEESLHRVDNQIAELHNQRKSTFYSSLTLEVGARVVSCLEIYFLMHILTPDVTFLDSMLIMAFSSLLSNLMFFLPMQLGAREGSLALATGGLNLTAGFGFFTGLLYRVRELIWIVIGIGLIKIANRKQPLRTTLEQLSENHGDVTNC